jgi:hypothetical protein
MSFTPPVEMTLSNRSIVSTIGSIFPRGVALSLVEDEDD